MKKEQQLLTRTSLGLKLSITPRHIYNLEKLGLPVIWVGAIPRYNYDDVVKWLKKNKKKFSMRGGDKNE